MKKKNKAIINKTDKLVNLRVRLKKQIEKIDREAKEKMDKIWRKAQTKGNTIEVRIHHLENQIDRLREKLSFLEL